MSWQGALGGEVIGGILSLILGRADIKRLFDHHGAQVAAGPREVEESKTGGSTLYFSNILSTAPFLTDRAMINAALGPATAGSYGVIAMIFQVGVLISNILTQWAGADIIKTAYLGDKRANSHRLIGKYFGLLTAAILVLIFSVLSLKALDLPSGFFIKYNISNLSIILGGVIGMTQIYALLEFLLIAKDRETYVFISSLTGAIAFYSSFGLAWHYGFPLEAFLAFALMARCLHILLLIVLFKKSNSITAKNVVTSMQEHS